MGQTTGDARAADTELERPLLTVSYELNARLVDKSAELLAGDPSRNPPAMVSVVLLVVIVAWGFATSSNEGIDPRSAPVVATAAALVVAAVAMGTLARRWQRVKLAELRRNGLDVALIPEGERRRTVSVFPDRVVVAPEQGEPTTYALGSMRKPKLGTELMLLRFGPRGFVPIPRRALSASRAAELERFVCERTGAKAGGQRRNHGRKA